MRRKFTATFNNWIPNTTYFDVLSMTEAALNIIGNSSRDTPFALFPASPSFLMISVAN